MNYYMPFTSYIPQAKATGLLGKIFKNGINWGSILTNTQKTLNIINQAIPVIKQAGPVVNNAKTMFKIMNEFKKVDTPKQSKKNDTTVSKSVSSKVQEKKITQNNNPVFFI